MRIAFVQPEIPNREHSTVTYSAFLCIEALRNIGHDVSTVLMLPEQSTIGDDATRRRWLSELSALDTHIYTLPLDVPQTKFRTRTLRRINHVRSLVFPRIADCFPHVAFIGAMEATLMKIQPDVIFLWGGYEPVAATHGVKVAPRFAFVGDPVHLPGLYRQYPPFSAERSSLSPSLLSYRIGAMQASRMLVRLLKACDAVAALAAHHAEWFRRNGVWDCQYMNNMVPDWGGQNWQRRRDEASPNERFKIVLMGHVTGTATLSGLHLFADETLPRLEQALGDKFEVHICGKGKLPVDLASKLDRPSVRLRGFVDDVIHEMMTCDAFLVPTPIELGIRIRIPYAWSCGCCVVAHQANARGLSEMLDGENALLAVDGRGLADALIRAFHDPQLRQQLGHGGRQTYEARFSHEVVSRRIIDAMATLLQNHRGRTAVKSLSQARAE